MLNEETLKKFVDISTGEIIYVRENGDIFYQAGLLGGSPESATKII